MNFIGIIPARYGSSRFPGKVLCDLHGIPMIIRTYRAAKKWNKWDEVYIAGDDDRITDVCQNYKVPFIMTGTRHTDCLDRIAEATSILQSKGTKADRYVVIQGDEPLFNVDTLNVDLSPEIVNFYTQTRDEEDLYSANAVKVVVSKSEQALYFSRYTIPYHENATRRSNEPLVSYKQIGVYSFSYDAIQTYHAQLS